MAKIWSVVQTVLAVARLGNKMRVPLSPPRDQADLVPYHPE